MKIKRIININLFAIVTLLLVSTSCEKWIDTDINESPNSPIDVPMGLILPSIQANMAYDLGGNDIVRTSNLLMQYYNGYARQSLSEARYSMGPSGPNNVWNSTYAGTLMDIKQLLDKSIEKNSPHFTGIAQVHMAYVLGTMTDIFGDIPYTEALEGDDNLTPAYDSQESIYTAIQNMLTEAIANLQATENAISVSGDLIYDGDLGQWVKAAYALKARYAITLSEVNGSAAYTEALGYLANAFESNEDNFQFNFDGTSQHPIYQFMDERGDITMSSYFIDMLVNDQDNRIVYYSSDGISSVGGMQGSDDFTDIALPGDYAAAEDASTYFMTYAEQKFIEAEALLATDAAAAYQAYLDGAVASVELVFANDDDYSTGDATTWGWYTIISVGQAALDLETIIKQKYIANFNTPQAFVDFRRTDYPVLGPVVNASGQIPRRFPYPQNALDYNSDNVPSGVTLQTNVWWDR